MPALPKSYWAQLLGIDLRTLALFRVAIAVAILAGQYGLFPIMFPVFDDNGLFPRAEAARRRPDAWSLYYLSGHVAWAYFLQGVTVFAALALLVGYRTRAATVICWLLLCSQSARTSIFNASDDLQIQVMLFWSMFLPLGARFSVDAALAKSPPKSNAYASAATLALMLQVAYLYFFGALLKTGAGWQEGTVIHYVLQTVDLNTWFSPYLAPWTGLTKWLTIGIWHLELLAIFFLFFPFKNAQCRLLILPFLIALHLGILIFMRIPWFPLVSISGLMVFVPGWLWDRFLPWLNARPKRRGITLYYDEACAFCRKTCLIFRQLGLPAATRIEPAQAVPEIHALMQRDNSWVVEDGAGARRTRWEAVAWVWRRSPLLWPLGVLFLPRFMRPVGDALYRAVADHRGAFGRLTARLLAEHGRELAFRLKPLTQLGIAVLAIMVLLWNVSTLDNRRFTLWPKSAVGIIHALRLTQKWGLFTGNRSRSVWMVFEGHLQDGTVVDVFRRRLEPPPHARPENAYGVYPVFRWHKFFNRVNYRKSRITLGRYFCAAWDDFRPDGAPPIEKVVITEYRQKNPPPGGDVAPPPKKRVVLNYDCRPRPPRANEKNGDTDAATY